MRRLVGGDAQLGQARKLLEMQALAVRRTIEDNREYITSEDMRGLSALLERCDKLLHKRSIFSGLRRDNGERLEQVMRAHASMWGVNEYLHALVRKKMKEQGS